MSPTERPVARRSLSWSGTGLRPSRRLRAWSHAAAGLNRDLVPLPVCDRARRARPEPEPPNKEAARPYPSPIGRAVSILVAQPGTPGARPAMDRAVPRLYNYPTGEIQTWLDLLPEPHAASRWRAGHSPQQALATPRYSLPIASVRAAQRHSPQGGVIDVPAVLCLLPGFVRVQPAAIVSTACARVKAIRPI